MSVKVVIDAGHGGQAPAGRSSPHGARGRAGTLEKDVTLELARRMATHLGGDAVLTRSSDVNLPLAERAAVARRSGARVFISLHANSGPPGQRGAEVYVHPQAGASSRALAATVSRRLARLGRPTQAVTEGELAVLAPQALAPNTAACLLEVDYLSDAQVERELRDPRALDRLGGTLAQAVREYLDQSADGRYGRAAASQGMSLTDAKALCTKGGSATDSDLDLVAAEVAKFPDKTLQALGLMESKFVVCRGSVTDYRTDLKGVKPRGWPPGSTWDSVPGLNQPNSKETVIAVIGHAAGKARVPKTGENHGCYNLVLHEGSHAIDMNGLAISRSTGPNFQKSRTSDLTTLSAYEQQSGNAGLEETYAESGSRFFGKDPNDAKNHPNLHDYWDTHIPGPYSDADA